MEVELSEEAREALHEVSGVEAKLKRDLFREVFSGVPTHHIPPSSASSSSSLTYGELTWDSFMEVLRRAIAAADAGHTCSYALHQCAQGAAAAAATAAAPATEKRLKFVDLGSGFGRLVVGAACSPLAYRLHTALGIEVSLELHDAAKAAKERLSRHPMGVLLRQEPSAVPPPPPPPPPPITTTATTTTTPTTALGTSVRRRWQQQQQQQQQQDEEDEEEEEEQHQQQQQGEEEEHDEAWYSEAPDDGALRVDVVHLDATSPEAVALWRDADVLYVCCTLFDAPLRKALGRLVDRHLRPGAVLVTVSRRLPAHSVAPLAELDAECTWGFASIHIGRKSADGGGGGGGGGERANGELGSHQQEQQDQNGAVVHDGP